MEQSFVKNNIFQELQREILALQGLKRPIGKQSFDTGLGPLENAFPDQAFPLGAVHEFISPTPEGISATTGFIAGLLGALMRQRGPCLWISTRRTLFPPALKSFGIAPDRVIFIDLARERDALWAMEEALKCEALAAVIGEIREINLTESRRLQLAVEKSRVTGFLHRCFPRKAGNIACASRWQVRPIRSELEVGLPGVGYPRWNVELLKIRNGRPGKWQIEWSDGRFRNCETNHMKTPQIYQKAG